MRYKFGPDNVLDQAQLVKKLNKFSRKKGPQERFAQLMRAHFDALYGAARRMTMSQDDAEDLVQDICVKAFERIDELERIEYPRAWLLKAMYNRFIDGQRKRGRQAIDIATTGEESADPETLASSAATLDELVDQGQHIDRVIRAMGYLDSESCALVAMHDVEGLSIHELCQITGQPSGTIKSRLHRTRGKLGRLLKNDALVRPHLRVVGSDNDE